MELTIVRQNFLHLPGLPASCEDLAPSLLVPLQRFEVSPPLAIARAHSEAVFFPVLHLLNLFLSL